MLADQLPFIVVVNVTAEMMTSSSTDVLPWWVASGASAAFLAVQLLQLGIWGRTWGCRLGKIRVVTYVDNSKATWAAVTIRCTIPFIASAIFVPVGAGMLGLFLELAVYFSALLDPHLRSVHDKAAGTIVIRA